MRLAGEAAQSLVGGRQIGSKGQAHQHHVGAGQRARRIFQFHQTLDENLPGPRQHRHRQGSGKYRAALAFGLGHGGIARRTRHQFQPRDEMHEFGQFCEDLRGIGTIVVLVFQNVQRGGNLAQHQRLEHVDDAGAVGEAQHGAQHVGAHAILAMRDGLIEQRQAIAHRAFGGPRDHRQRLVLDGDALLGANSGKVGDQHIGLDPAQVETLAA